VVQPRYGDDSFVIGARSGARLSGSHPIALRPRDDEDEPPDPDEEPPPPPPPVSVPDLGVQIKDIRGSQPECASAEDRARLVAAVREAVAGRFPNADVRATCIPAGDPAANTETIGIWTRPAVGSSASEARDRGLARLQLLDGPEVFAIFVNAGFIRRFADETFAAMPKRLDGEGRADSDGPVHLTELSVSFDSPSRVITTIRGYDERPWPDVNFTLTVTDTLSAQSFALACSSEQHLDTDSGWLQAITGALALASFFSPWFLPAFAFFVYQTVQVLSAEPPDQGGVGRAVLQLLPAEIPVPGGQKLTFLYSRVEVTGGGLFAGGSYLPTARQPTVSIVGPTPLVADVNQGFVTGMFRALHDDFRGTPSCIWSGGTPNNQGSRVTSIRFSTGGAGVGSSVVRQLTVNVTDADGLTAQSTRTIQIRVTDMNDDDIPPICRAKPWMCDEEV
jgi:hypothetical protein